MTNHDAVFGDQSMFRFAPPDAEMVDSDDRFYKRSNGCLYRLLREKWVSTDIAKGKIAAERIVIPDDKYFTIEDMIAGRRPHIGQNGFDGDGSPCEYIGDSSMPSSIFVRYENNMVTVIPIKDFRPTELPTPLTVQNEYDKIKVIVDRAINDRVFGINQLYIRTDSFNKLCELNGLTVMKGVYILSLMDKLGYIPIRTVKNLVRVTSDWEGNPRTIYKTVLYISKSCQYKNSEILAMVQFEHLR